MEQNVFREVRNALEFLTTLSTITYELSKTATNTETAIQLYNKLENGIGRLSKYFATVHATVVRSLDDLRKSLLTIFDTFNDNEAQILVKTIFENKSAKEIAEELDISEGFVWNTRSAFKKRFDDIKKGSDIREVVEELNNMRTDYLFVNLSNRELDLLLCALSGTDFNNATRNLEKENLTKRIIALKEEQESGKNDE